MRAVGGTDSANIDAILRDHMPYDAWWLDVAPGPAFAALMGADVRSRPDFGSVVVPYMNQRGVEDEEAIEDYARIDLAHLAQAFTILFAADHNQILSSMMPDHLYQVIHDVRPTIDHVGREIFGPIDFYLSILHDLADDLGIVHDPLSAGPNVTERGDMVFGSVQVVEALHQFDPDLQGVTIGRTAFTSAADPSHTCCVELFQPSLRDNSAPQPYGRTLERMSNLHAESNRAGDGLSLEPPICHISIRAPRVETVYELHEVAKSDATGMVMPYVENVAVNPADGSTNTKISIRHSVDNPVYNQIIEIVHLLS